MADPPPEKWSKEAIREEENLSRYPPRIRIVRLYFLYFWYRVLYNYYRGLGGLFGPDEEGGYAGTAHRVIVSFLIVICSAALGAFLTRTFDVSLTTVILTVGAIAFCLSAAHRTVTGRSQRDR